MKAILEDFKIYLLETGRVTSKMTIDSYLGNIKQLIEWLKSSNKVISDLDRVLILKYLDHLKKKDYKPNTYNTKINSLTNFIDNDGDSSHAIVSNDDLKLNTEHSKASLELETINIDNNIDRDVNFDGIDKYVPVLDLLYENKDKLADLLLDDEENTPRYIIPGAAKTKSIYMNDKLARLMADFLSNNGVSQRDIVEAGIIMYLKKYGGSYAKDVEMLLSKK